MYFIHEVNGIADLTKFVFGIYQDESLFGGNFLTTGK